MDLIRYNGDGTTTTFTDTAPDALIELRVRQGIEAGIEKRLGASTSAGATWLSQYRLEHQEYIFAVECGESLGSWFIKKLSCDDLDLMATLMSGLCGYGVVQLSSAESKSAFSRALLHVGVCCGLHDPTRKFGTFDVASLFYQEPRAEAPLLAGLLRDELLLLNDIWGSATDSDGKKKAVLLTPSDFG